MIEFGDDDPLTYSQRFALEQVLLAVPPHRDFEAVLAWIRMVDAPGVFWAPFDMLYRPLVVDFIEGLEANTHARFEKTW